MQLILLLLTGFCLFCDSAYRNFDVSTSMAGRRPMLPKFHPLAGGDGRNFSPGGLMLNRSNNYSCPASMYKEMNTLMIPTINSEFDRNRSNNFLNNIHYSITNPLKNSFSDKLHGIFIFFCSLNFNRC